MTYRILRVYVRFIFRFFAKSIKINGIENVPKDKAVLFAAFHSNSFLDAVVLDLMIKRPIWSLARGDAFKKPFVRKIFKKLYMMPIYRLSEGKQNLNKNDGTFEKCEEVFKNAGQVQIFSEGLCKNQTQLLPLKKGTARLALQTWDNNVGLTVIPTAVNYSQFTELGKKIVLNFSEPINLSDFADTELTGGNIRDFNEKLRFGLEKAVTRDFDNSHKINLLYYPGYVINFPLYYILKVVVRSKTKGTVFFDSVYFALLIVALPIYWGLLLVLFSVFYS